MPDFTQVKNDNAYGEIDVRKSNNTTVGKGIDKRQLAELNSSNYGQEIDKVSVPSQLSEDVWGEVPRYQYLRYQEDLKREKEADRLKRDRVRATLDEQVRARQASKLAHQDRARAVDARILAKAKAEMDGEKAKKDVLKEKTLTAKAERDKQLRAAKQRRDAEYQD